VISPYARREFIDHQTLSFDAYVKFIEDDFLGGQRLDPKTDGRPDPRPDVREDLPQLGNLALDFDFSVAPRPPLLLPVDPHTDLIPPAAPAGSAPRTARNPRLSAALGAVAAFLGMTPRQLRAELADGRTLRQIAREHGETLAQVRRALRRAGAVGPQ
jgi:hypothetical protein